MAPGESHANVLVKTDAGAVLLIRRIRRGRVYYLAPGTPVRDGETPGAAAMRAATAFGIDAVVEELLYAEAFAGVEHYFFLGTASSDTSRPVAASCDELDDWELVGERGGSFELVQLPLRSLRAYDVRPPSLARRAALAGRAANPVA